MHRSAEDEILMANLPIDLTAFRTKSTSTSDAYLEKEKGEEDSIRRYVVKKESALYYSLFQFSQHLFDILLTTKSIHDFQLCHLDIDGVIVFAKEDFDLVL